MMLFLMCFILVALGAVTLKAAENALTTGKAKQAKAIEHDYSKPIAEDCPLFVTHIFERRLIEEGIPTEMDTCDNHNCPECLPIVKEKTAKRLEAAKMVALEQKKVMYEEAYKRETARREAATHLTIQGKKVPWPSHVPERASVWVDENYSRGAVEVQFKWVDNFTHATYGYKLLVAKTPKIKADYHRSERYEKNISKWVDKGYR